MKTNIALKEVKSVAIRAFATFLLLFAGYLASATDFMKTYQEKYSVQKGAVLAIQNKFGDIHCQLWDESSVSIKVTITVDASSQDKANRVFDKISVQLSGSPMKVSGITSVGSINNGEFSIDYDIMMPRWVNLELDNKFGELFIDETDGTAKINLEYGAMEINALNSTINTLTVKFSEMETGYVKDGKINIEYSEWECGGSDKMDVYSRFSELTIEKTGNLKLDSQYDDVTVGKTGPVISISRFSDLDFGRISGSFDFDTEYGEVVVDYISADFGTGKVRNSFAGVNLGFDRNASFTVDAEIKFGELDYPKANSSLKHEEVGYTTNIYKGRIGSSASPSSHLNIDTKNAGVRLEFED